MAIVLFGGIAGRIRQNGKEVKYNYNLGNVTNTGKGMATGGIVGSHESGTASNCYNFASVTSNGSRVGTIVGYQTGTGKVNSCTNVSGSSPNPTIYYVVNGLNNEESDYWAKEVYSNETLQTPKLKWEIN